MMYWYLYIQVSTFARLIKLIREYALPFFDMIIDMECNALVESRRDGRDGACNVNPFIVGTNSRLYGHH